MYSTYTKSPVQKLYRGIETLLRFPIKEFSPVAREEAPIWKYYTIIQIDLEAERKRKQLSDQNSTGSRRGSNVKQL